MVEFQGRGGLNRGIIRFEGGAIGNVTLPHPPAVPVAENPAQAQVATENASIIDTSRLINESQVNPSVTNSDISTDLDSRDPFDGEMGKIEKDLNDEAKAEKTRKPEDYNSEKITIVETQVQTQLETEYQTENQTNFNTISNIVNLTETQVISAEAPVSNPDLLKAIPEGIPVNTPNANKVNLVETPTINPNLLKAIPV
ncbi:hypothetical protein AYI70_g5064 [Smittium culicis]|uniref:Uncharacterized protein n=1 Tax=Smittium culicis TaxID=133412 RepID=A0A1R1XW77_9FUNG|nr:hypothetical protein AYI70_g5064 [Smittium culicis]